MSKSEQIFEEISREAINAALEDIRKKGGPVLNVGEEMTLALGVSFGIRALLDRLEREAQTQPDHFAE